jgi:hypothetical protein
VKQMFKAKHNHQFGLLVAIKLVNAQLVKEVKMSLRLFSFRIEVFTKSMNLFLNLFNDP